jgi:hypothetical protein
MWITPPWVTKAKTKDMAASLWVLLLATQLALAIHRLEQVMLMLVTPRWTTPIKTTFRLLINRRSLATLEFKAIQVPNLNLNLKPNHTAMEVCPLSSSKCSPKLSLVNMVWANSNPLTLNKQLTPSLRTGTWSKSSAQLRLSPSLCSEPSKTRTRRTKLALY